jgi:inosine/xanthosine triphosphatase
MEKISIIVASKNPVKKRAARDAFMEVFFPEIVGYFNELYQFINEWLNPTDICITGMIVPSGVSEQPKTEPEVYNGALNRLVAIKQLCPDADYWVAIEGGIVDDGVVMEEIGYVLVASKEGSKIFRGQVPRFEVPTKIAERIRSGQEMGPANDEVFGKENSKQGGGMAGEVTNQRVDRYDITLIAAIFAFSSLKNKHLYEAVDHGASNDR